MDVGIVFLKSEITTLEIASTAITDIPMTIAGSSCAVTASVEQIPKICTSTGLSLDSGLNSASLFRYDSIIYCHLFGFTL